MFHISVNYGSKTHEVKISKKYTKNMWGVIKWPSFVFVLYLSLIWSQHKLTRRTSSACLSVLWFVQLHLYLVQPHRGYVCLFSCCFLFNLLCVFLLFTLVKAQVLYDFSAEPGNNELTVKEGETVTITNQVSFYTRTPVWQITEWY